jgi:hypothetical protein
MDHDEFEDVFDVQVRACSNTLIAKGKEYSPVDRFSNFKIAASFQGCTPKEALGGMLAKHIVSVYDLIRSEADIPMAMWDEKIGDALNYLFLLKGMVVEENNANNAAILTKTVTGGRLSSNNVEYDVVK